MGLADPLPDYRGAGRLAGRRALVVGDFGDAGGAAGGVLAAVAAALAKEGAAVAVAGDAGRPGAVAGPLPAVRPTDTVPRPRPFSAVECAAQGAAALGALTLALHCPMDGEASCRAAVAHAALEFGALDLLVPAVPQGPDTHRESVAWLVRAARDFMLPGASVVLVGAAWAADPAGWARSLGASLRGRGIRVGTAGADPAAGPEERARACVRAAVRNGAPSPAARG
ncbi:hypothetical protein O4J56_28915 [Nocardiopsis sp. RSe5-2]|uniref:Uncharacterized protein n=1 Tax=Nocardiopsis endophytica TaxID=3018445 RepID=A0ABT4UEC0_9ACTN|nr:hypothetical protein [Nocardiopsis endophytica]MDA2814700.1 hypothetical protein [Nocardiopsis endophytica]